MISERCEKLKVPQMLHGWRYVAFRYYFGTSPSESRFWVNLRELGGLLLSLKGFNVWHGN